MSTTKYGPSVSNVWRAYIRYDTTDHTTYVSVDAVTGMQSLGWGFNLSGLTAVININGNRTSTSNATFYSATGATVSKDFVRQSTVNINKTHSKQTITIEGRVNNTTGYKNGQSYVKATVTIPAKNSYRVNYNANGGSGAPGSQTKWYGENLSLSGTRPTRTGYSFQGWGTSASGSVAYQPGSTYSANASITLYAIWRANTYTVSYNANSGSGAPGAQTKTYGVNLTLSSTRPTRTNYNFKGWATSASGSVAYQPGGRYTSNASVTLYAIWELAYTAPRISNLTATRCNSAGTLADDGTYAKVTFNWATDKTVTGISIVCNGVTTKPSASGTSGSVSQVVGANALNTENTYVVTVTVSDGTGSSNSYTTIAPLEYILDFEPNGSAAFGGPAKSYGSSPSVDFYSGIVNRVAPMVSSNDSQSGGGSSGYIRVLTFTHAQGGTYANSGIEFTVLTRARYPITCNVVFSSVNSNQLTMSAATCYSCGQNYNNIVYYRSPSTNTCEIWVKKTESWDVCRIGDIHYDRFYMPYLTYDTTPSFSSSLPSGCTAIVYRSLQYIPENKKSGYYGLRTPENDTDWLRTTSSGIIPYTSNSSSGSSAIGTSGWPFNVIWVQQLSWNSQGLGGRVYQQIWSGSWSSGSITVSNANYYNVFGIANSTNNVVTIWSRGKGKGKAAGIHGVSGFAQATSQDHIWFSSFYISTDSAGTRWTLTGANQVNMNPDTSNMTHSNLTVTNIYGIM